MNRTFRTSKSVYFCVILKLYMRNHGNKMRARRFEELNSAYS